MGEIVKLVKLVKWVKWWKGEKVKRYMLCICALAVFAAGAATIDCGDAELSLDELGRIAGLRDRGTGRELAGVRFGLVGGARRVRVRVPRRAARHDRRVESFEDAPDRGGRRSSGLDRGGRPSHGREVPRLRREGRIPDRAVPPAHSCDVRGSRGNSPLIFLATARLEML